MKSNITLNEDRAQTFEMIKCIVNVRHPLMHKSHGARGGQLVNYTL